MRRPQDIARSSRAWPCVFELPDGTEIEVPPLSADQTVRLLRLDPPADRPETPLEEMVRIQKQARIVLGPDLAHLTGTLPVAVLGLLVGAVYVASRGMDAEAFARWQIAERQAKRSIDTLAAIANLEDATSRIAAETGKLPAEVGAQPLADILAFSENLSKVRAAEVKFQAALHGRTLQ